MTNVKCQMFVCLRQILIIFFVCLFSFAVAAQNKDLVINGDNVTYDKANHLIEAAGSVEVVYRDVRITSNYLVYNTELNKAWADRGFNLSYGDISLEGSSLEYEIMNKQGQARDVAFVYHGIELTGKRIELSTDEFKLKNASFTTCDLENDHYRVTASDINFYPKYGWLVAYWGYFWLGPVPLVPMPTYIYDMLANEHNRRNIPPFPDIGSNDEDGSYINERLAWHIRRKLSGSYSITYTTKKGLGGGLEIDYILNDDSRGNARLYANGIDGPYGGLTHSLFFGQEIAPADQVTLNIFDLPKQRQYQFDTVLSYHERINYQRISYYPNLVLRSQEGKLLRDEANLDVELELGLVAERYNTRLARGKWQFDFYWDFPETDFGDLTPGLGIDSRHYSNGVRWARTTGRLDLKKAFSPTLVFGLGYLHHFDVQGASPFLYEMYKFNPADKLTSELNFMLGEAGLNLYTAYYLDTWQPEDIDYSLLFRMHCYNLQIKYRSIRREFELGFSLAGAE